MTKRSSSTASGAQRPPAAPPDPGGPPLPRLWPDTEFFWTSGADGRLRFMKCQDCEHLVHPPTPLCRHCRSEHVEPAVVSGRAHVWSFSVVHQPFVPWLETPYVVGLVSIDDEPEVHMTTRIVGCAPEAVKIGMPLRVRFEQHGAIFLPLFEPVTDDEE